MEAEKKYFAGWWLWILLLIVVSFPVLFGMRSCGLIGGTILERKVFENSYQYTEARKTEMLTYQAQLAEIEGKLLNPDLDPSTRTNLEAQASAIRIQLNVVQGR